MQLAVITAIVATLLLIPVVLGGLLVALVAGIPPLALISWGGALPEPVGLLALWAAMLGPAGLYVALVLRH